MALTITATRDPSFVQPERVGSSFISTLDWTLASTYVTGGHAYTQTELGGVSPAAVQEIFFTGGFRNGTNVVKPEWDEANKKIMFFETTTGAPSKLVEVANATSLASYAGKVKVKHLA